MARTNLTSRRRSTFPLWLGISVFFALFAAGGAGILMWLEVLPNPWSVARDDPFMVRIPTNSQPIPAYTRVERTHLLLDRTGKFSYQRIPPAATVGMSIEGIAADGSHLQGKVTGVRRDGDRVVFLLGDGREVPQEKTLELGGAILDPNAIIGRVVKRDKRPGMGFRQDTFFPRGTPEGIAGATPLGMRSLTFDATKLAGVHALRAGDRLDLLASVPAGQFGEFSLSHHERTRPAAVTRGRSEGTQEDAVEPILLAQNAVVIKPVHVRQEASTTSSLTQGKRVQNLPKYEVTLAVAPEDLLPLQSALNKSLAITCVAHSMQPSRATDDEPSTDASSEDVVTVPVTVRPTLAYEVVTRETFISPATRRLRQERLDRAEATRLGIITSLDEALGAVARHDIPAGSFVRRSDLLTGSASPPSASGSADRRADRRADGAQPPWRFASQASSSSAGRASERADLAPITYRADDAPPRVVGDRPTIASFIPPGQTAFAIPWNRLYGAEHLQIGDRIDVLASFALERTGRNAETETRPDGTVIERQLDDVASRRSRHPWDESIGQRAEPWFVATEATIVGPVGFPPPAAAQRALAQMGANQRSGPDTDGISGPPLILAVDDQDVTTLSAALAAQGTIFTLAIHRSAGEQLGPGLRRVAIAAHELDAYEVFSESVWLGNRRRPVERVVRDDDPRFAAALDAQQLATYSGRTLARAKRRGEPFWADDFAPHESGAGLGAAARPGHSLFAVSDQEVEGLDAFPAGARVALLERRKVSPPAESIVHGGPGERVVAAVVVPAATIVRGARGGQVILEVPNRDLTRLQAKWAETHGESGAEATRPARSNLVAVAISVSSSESSRGASKSDRALDAAPARAADQVAIPSYDSAGDHTTVEAVVGARRQFHVFLPQNAASRSELAPRGSAGP